MKGISQSELEQKIKLCEAQIKSLNELGTDELKAFIPKYELDLKNFKHLLSSMLNEQNK